MGEAASPAATRLYAVADFLDAYPETRNPGWNILSPPIAPARDAPR